MNGKKQLTELEIDDIVISQADDDEAWEDAVDVYGADSATISLPPTLAARAAFLAQLHNMPDAETWLQSIIRERIDFEEAAFAGLKQVMEQKAAYQA
ncbi:MAG: hypothetical protein IAE79_25680 [Anaerolinea sp.]|nr:hypothetical protein [Anaerolinea sp.]